MSRPAPRDGGTGRLPFPVVLPTPCFIFGDAHLGAVPPAVEASVLAFLARARAAARSVVVNGDLFDFWFEWRHVMPRTGFRVAAALAGLVEAGIPVRWQAGNHDCWGGALLREDVGADYAAAPYVGAIGGWRAFVHHGDGLRGDADAGYRRWQAVLRHPLAMAAFRRLPADFASALALGTSRTSRAHTTHDEGSGLRQVAHARLAAGGSDLVVFGHAHAAELSRGPDGGVYANHGAWMDAPTYLRVDDGRIALCRLTSSREDDVLDTLDRLAEEPGG